MEPLPGLRLYPDGERLERSGEWQDQLYRGDEHVGDYPGELRQESGLYRPVAYTANARAGEAACRLSSEAARRPARVWAARPDRQADAGRRGGELYATEVGRVGRATPSR